MEYARQMARSRLGKHRGPPSDLGLSPFSPLPPPVFPFSFTDPPLPFKRNATHIQRHRCSSLVSFFLQFFFCFVLIKCIVLGIAALRSQTTVQGNKQISGGLFAKPTLGFQALSGQVLYSKVLTSFIRPLRSSLMSEVYVLQWVGMVSSLFY